MDKIKFTEMPTEHEARLYLTTIGDVVYVPAAFFEEAMGVGIKREGESVSISTPEPKETPEKEEQSGGESG